MQRPLFHDLKWAVLGNGPSLEWVVVLNRNNLGSQKVTGGGIGTGKTSSEGVLEYMDTVRLREMPAMPAIDARDPRTIELLAYWCSKRGTRLMPSRRDIDPIEIPKLLPFISLTDIVPGAPIEQRYRVRLFGTKLVDLYERDWTGRTYFEATNRETAQRIVQSIEFVVNHRHPWFVSGRLGSASKREGEPYEAMYLPLSRDQENVDMLLGFVAFPLG